MDWILGSGLRFGRLVVALAIGLTVIGIAQLHSAPADVYPEFMPPSVEIQTEALGLSAAEVEQLVTLGLEQDLLNGVPWLDRIHSSSMPGLSVIDLTFQPGTDLYAARQQVQERLSQAHALPNVGSPPIMIQPTAASGRVAMIRLSSSSVSAIDMSVLARWKIKPRLMGVPGVANVAIYGQRDRQLQVQVDPKKLRADHVTLTQLIETAGNALWVSPLTFVEASTPGTGGFFESSNQRLSVQHISPISTPGQLAAVPVQDVSKLRLGDVANVIEDHQPLIGDAVSAGPPSLFLVIEKFPGADTLKVTRDVEAAMADMAPGLKGITIDTQGYRPASFIEAALRNAGWAALIGFVLLIALLFVIFASWRAALIGAIVLPVSLTTAAYVLYLQGTTFTTITLLGLAAAVCIMVDDVITDINTARGIPAGNAGEGERADGDAPVRAAFAAVRGPLVFATLAMLLGTVPFLFLGTVATAFSGPLVLAFALAVLSSMVVSLLLTPTLGVLLLRGRGGHRPSPLAGGTRRLFDLGLGAIARPGRAWALAGVLVLALLAIIPQTSGNGSLLPALQDRNLLLHVQALPGTSLTEMDRITAAAGNELHALPGVRGVGTHVGRAIGSDQLTDVNSAEVWITLDDRADYARTKAAISTVMHGYPGLRTDLVTYPGDRVGQVEAASRDDLVVRVYGADLGVLQRKAGDVRAMLTHVSGVANPVVRPIPQQPTVAVKVNLAAAQKYGLRPGDIRRDATTLTSGLIVGNLYEQSKIFDVVVWGAPQIRSNLTELGNMLIDTPGGGQVALKDVASLTVRAEPAAIVHDGVLRTVEVAARVTGDPAAVAAAVRAQIARMPMPYEYHAEVFGGATIRSSDAARGLAWGAVALAGIFLLLQAAVGSWRRAGLMLASLPLSAAGAVLTAPLAGGISTIASLTGLFAVLALALRACVLLGRRIDSGVEAARDRAVAVLQTVLAAAALLAPAAFMSSGPGLELLHPLAVTMLGGLVSLLLVQGLLLPALLLPRPERAAVSQGGRRPIPEPAGHRYRVRIRRTTHTERP
ncbi:MAG TPA: efflux RND transporter permease subunit [Streptosporangiaceae bacterium]|nr:efflux RND transporter permease subunit [Streptosporangiaceae bacterium]